MSQTPDRNSKGAPVKPPDGSDLATTSDTTGFLGHPAGLKPLCTTETGERFSFYGMKAILLYFMVAPPSAGGLGFSDGSAQSLLGTYMMSVYLACIPGGLVADKWLGARNAIRLGAILIIIGHFTMVFHSLAAFYGGLAFVVVGTGLLKPSISNLLGGLYNGKDDPRRDTGFSIFYLGINVGAFLAPLVCGFLAQNEWFRALLERHGMDPNDSWHWGFGAAGVAMILGLIQYEMAQKKFGSVGLRPKKGDRTALNPPLTKEDWRRMGAIAILFVFAVLFFAIYEQGSNSLGLFADRLTVNQVPLVGWTFPSSWFQSINPLFIMILTPFFAWFWKRLGKKQPSSPIKFALGLFFMSAAIGVMVIAALFTTGGRVTPMWLCAFFFLECIGEMCLSPVGLSTVTKLSPARFSGLMLGVWFLASALGGKLAGILSSYYSEDVTRMVTLFGGMAIACLAGAVLLVKVSPTVKNFMGSEEPSGSAH